MAAKDLHKKTKSPQKRKENPGANTHSGSSISKKPKLGYTKPSSKPPSKDSKNKPQKQLNSNHGGEKKAPMSKSEGRKLVRELAEARKRKRNHHYDLDHELASLSEKIRVRRKKEEDRSKFNEERSKLVSEAIEKMKGKIPDIAASPISSRVLQMCVKHCSQAEREKVFEELRPHLLGLSTSRYAVFLVKKMLDNASKNQLATAISAFHGHVASLLRHKIGSAVIEHAYQLGNAAQKQGLLMELCSTELQIFKDLISTQERRLVDVMSKLNLSKASVLRHMKSVIEPMLKKGIIRHSIIHRALIEYLSIADESSATYVIQTLSSALLGEMIKTKDGARIGILCVKLGSAKERKKILKVLKGGGQQIAEDQDGNLKRKKTPKGRKCCIQEIAKDQYGSMVLVCILSLVDDTKYVTKVVINDVKKNIDDLVFDKNGRRLLLQLLHPNCSRYFSPDYLTSFDLSVPSLSSKDKGSSEEGKSNNVEDKTKADANRSSDHGKSHSIFEGGKKDPFVRRQELLVNSGLAEKLVDVCIENAGELLRSNTGKDVIYEVATGGADGILNTALEDKLNALHEAIVSLVAEPKSEESNEEHILENFHSSRTLRKLILDCPSFASTLWNKDLKKKCESWATGHSGKVLTAFLASSDPNVRNLANKKLQGLIDRGLLKIPEKQSTVATEI